MVRVLVLALFLLVGCVGPAVDAAAQAERRIGRSSADALEQIGSLASGLRVDAAPVASEAAALLASARGRVDEGHGFAFWVGIGLVAILVASHAVHLALRLDAVHEDVRDIKRKHESGGSP